MLLLPSKLLVILPGPLPPRSPPVRGNVHGLLLSPPEATLNSLFPVHARPLSLSG